MKQTPHKGRLPQDAAAGIPFGGQAGTRPASLGAWRPW